MNQLKNIKMKRLNIEGFMSTADNETYLTGTDENGNDFQVIFSTIELLEWLDIDYMKEKAKEYINNLNVEL